MGAKDTVTQFKETMDILISKFATRLLKLNVDEVEVKVCTSSTEDIIISTSTRCVFHLFVFLS